MDHSAMQSEIRRLAKEKGAVILAHNYQRSEVQDVADFVGDSLGLSRQAAATTAAPALQGSPAGRRNTIASAAAARRPALVDTLVRKSRA